MFSRRECGEAVKLTHSWITNGMISTCKFCDAMWFNEKASVMLMENCPVREYEEGLRIV